MRISPYLLALSVLLTGCGLIEVDRQDIQQGNRLDASEIRELKVGMTRPQVAELLGTPVLKNPFHADRWDYVYYETEAGEEPDETPHRLTIHFSDDDVVTRIDDRYPAGNGG